MTGAEDQAAALRRLVARLDDTAALLAGLRHALSGTWDDAAGREWLGRLDLVRREAHRLADDAAGAAAGWEERHARDASSAVRVRHGTGDLTGPGAGGTAAPEDRNSPGSSSWPGLRLPGTHGARTTDRRGMVAPLLSQDPDAVPPH
ncbi:hypothetical protein WIS52_08985 [Pseudonocardia nematodicida]|uniref:WXG100 family type VII secretion target n=1 Tax=Pseudonocardia nematodicida TaxID=1206997 RepID=A0ABV1K7Z5_9PSEU